MTLSKIGCGIMEWIKQPQDRFQRRAFVRTAVNLLVLRKEGRFLTSLATIIFPRTHCGENVLKC
jgi:hypothetical protein